MTGKPDGPARALIGHWLKILARRRQADTSGDRRCQRSRAGRSRRVDRGRSPPAQWLGRRADRIACNFGRCMVRRYRAVSRWSRLAACARAGSRTIRLQGPRSPLAERRGTVNAHVSPEQSAAHSLDTEQALLGAILMFPETLARLGDRIATVDFFDDLHKAIYSASESLSAQGIAPNAVTLPPVIGPMALPGGMTLARYLAQLSSDALPAAQAPGLARIARDLAMRRKLAALCSDAQQIANGPTGSVRASAIAASLEHFPIRRHRSPRRRDSFGILQT
jgi:hypothetical protein